MLYSPSRFYDKFTLNRGTVIANQMPEQLIVGNMMPCGLTYSLVPLAGEGKDITVAELFFHLFGNRMNVVTDKPQLDTWRKLQSPWDETGHRPPE